MTTVYPTPIIGPIANNAAIGSHSVIPGSGSGSARGILHKVDAFTIKGRFGTSYVSRVYLGTALVRTLP